MRREVPGRESGAIEPPLSVDRSRVLTLCSRPHLRACVRAQRVLWLVEQEGNVCTASLTVEGRVTIFELN
jgi:hypothetical protein